MRINKFFATTFSIFMLLLLGGVASYLFLGGIDKSERLLGEFRVGVYIADSVSGEKVCELENKIKQDTRVESLTVVGKEDAAREFDQKLGIKLGDKNPLPISFRVKLKKGVDVKAFDRQVAQMVGVEQVDYPYAIANDVQGNLKTLAYFGFGFCVILGLVIVVVFRNVVRMDVAASSEAVKEAVARRMPTTYIRQPFLVRAFTQGAIAGGLASVFLFIATNAIATLYPFTNLNIDIAVMLVICAIMTLAGMLLSWLFAFFAVGNQIKSSL